MSGSGDDWDMLQEQGAEEVQGEHFVLKRWQHIAQGLLRQRHNANILQEQAAEARADERARLRWQRLAIRLRWLRLARGLLLRQPPPRAATVNTDHGSQTAPGGPVNHPQAVNCRLRPNLVDPCMPPHRRTADKPVRY